MTSDPGAPTARDSHYSAFANDRLLGRGSYADIAQALAAAGPLKHPVLVFDDASGAPVDAPHSPEQAALLARLRGGATAAQPPDPAKAARPPRQSPGRPRLGVVAREVTLLPRHWEWLASQPGGASAALRRLVDQARKSNEKADRRRLAGEKSYRFMSAIAGHRPGFEEAARALFAADGAAFRAHIARWPKDVRAHLTDLAQDAFDPMTDDRPAP